MTYLKAEMTERQTRLAYGRRGMTEKKGYNGKVSRIFSQGKLIAR